VSYTPEHKRQTRERIINTASGLFKSDGFEAVSIDTVMNAAGLTRGGFYAHFKDKQDLFNHSVLPRKIEAGEFGTPEECNALLTKILDFYLSPGHRDNPGEGCPLPALSRDIARQGGSARKRYRMIFKGFADILSRCLTGIEPAKRDAVAEAILLMMIGAVTTARALGTGKSSDAVLHNGRFGCERLAKID